MATKKKINRRRKKAFFLRVGIVAILVYLLVFLIQLQMDLRDKTAESSQLTEQIKAQNQLNAGLISQNKDYSQYLEERAHAAGYARPGEIFFQEYAGPAN